MLYKRWAIGSKPPQVGEEFYLFAQNYLPMDRDEIFLLFDFDALFSFCLRLNRNEIDKRLEALKGDKEGDLSASSCLPTWRWSWKTQQVIGVGKLPRGNSPLVRVRMRRRVIGPIDHMEHLCINLIVSSRFCELRLAATLETS